MIALSTGEALLCLFVAVTAGAIFGSVYTQWTAWRRDERARARNIADYRAAHLSPLPPIPVDVSRLERRGDVARVVRLSSWRRGA